ncbi:PAN domain-containing protein [Synechococcus sp. UW140]
MSIATGSQCFGSCFYNPICRAANWYTATHRCVGAGA